MDIIDNPSLSGNPNRIAPNRMAPNRIANVGAGTYFDKGKSIPAERTYGAGLRPPVGPACRAGLV